MWSNGLAWKNDGTWVPRVVSALIVFAGLLALPVGLLGIVIWRRFDGLYFTLPLCGLGCAMWTIAARYWRESKRENGLLPNFIIVEPGMDHYIVRSILILGVILTALSLLPLSVALAIAPLGEWRLVAAVLLGVPGTIFWGAIFYCVLSDQQSTPWSKASDYPRGGN